jgi:hypothetical protein
MFHERFVPYTLGLPEAVLIVVYGGIVGAWLLVFRDQLRGPRLPLLLVAGACFASMVVIDLLDFSRVVEDGVKYVGMITILGYALGEGRASFLAAARGER